jgi:hypothetical protein
VWGLNLAFRVSDAFIHRISAALEGAGSGKLMREGRSWVDEKGGGGGCDLSKMKGKRVEIMNSFVGISWIWFGGVAINICCSYVVYVKRLDPRVV